MDLGQDLPGFVQKSTDTHQKDACMIFYDETELLYHEADASVVGLEVGILQVRDAISSVWNVTLDTTILWPIAFASKGLSSTERWYINIERDTLGILHGLW